MAIAQFRRQFPSITVDVSDVDDHFEIESMLRSGQADIGVVDLPCSEEFETWEICWDEYVVLLPDSMKLNQTRVTWKQLATYPLILSANHSCSLPIRQYLQRSIEPVNIAYEMKQDSALAGMAMQGLGAAIMPRLAAEPVPETIKLYSLPVPLERIIKVAVLKKALHTPAVFAFLDALKNAQTQKNSYYFSTIYERASKKTNNF